MQVKVKKIIDKKTAKVFLKIHKKHKKYGKYTEIQKAFMVDTNGIELILGQVIEIKSSKPLSKRKRWIINTKKT